MSRKSVVRLPDRPDMLDVYHGRKNTTTQQQQQQQSNRTEADLIAESDQAVRAMHSCNS